MKKVESHLEMLTDEKRNQGMSATEARNAALREFGGVSQMREKYREMSGLKAVEFLAQRAPQPSHVETKSRICHRHRSAAGDRIVISRLRPLFSRMCGDQFYLCQFGRRLPVFKRMLGA
jgi:hypothetical protein